MLRKVAIGIVISIMFYGCEEDSYFVDATTKAEASKFVDDLMIGLREGTLDVMRCPNVQWLHIPALFEYAKSTETVGDDPNNGSAKPLPFNPLSSFLLFQCSEGMFALWMVEAARLHTLNPELEGFLGWPSNHPIIGRVDKEGHSIQYINDDQVQEEILAIYTSWWNSAKGRKSSAKIDPLEGTGYRWL